MKDDLKTSVKDAYSKIVKARNCGCGCSGDSSSEFNKNLKIAYSKIEGWQPDADYGLGCGIPTDNAAIKEGDTVVDLGSGAGNDAFIAAKIVGENGRVIGLDMTEAMIAKANENKKKHGYKNVEFVRGDIENMPLESGISDVVISNCVLNLIPDKKKAFAEIYRILKSGGHFNISDIVIIGTLPEKLKKSIELYTSCLAGALKKEDYLKLITDTGFKNVRIISEYKAAISDEDLQKLLSPEEIRIYLQSENGVVSITVYGEK